MLRQSIRILSLSLLLALGKPLPAAQPDSRDVEFFETRIRPVLVEHCFSCHSTQVKKPKGGLLLDSRSGLLKGGDNGPALVPGDPANSLLIQAIQHQSLKMPPQSKLPNKVIADFIIWVKRGAPDPRTEKAPTARTRRDLNEGRKFWSFQPPRVSLPPKVKDPRRIHTPIDAFVWAGLEVHGLKPVAPASKRQLIRRATFDLTGLPPTPAEVEAFLHDDSPDAFARVVDRLLQSPHYGERWARHWLDVARYAEDQGNALINDYPNAYRYRDWVVRAFNDDLPYDQFVLQQIAGDLLDPDSYESRAALGFVALGQLFQMMDKEQEKFDALADRVDTLARTFLGLTVGCARCHDHKFDPIPTQDYYALAGIFANTEFVDKAVLVSPAVQQRYQQKQERVQVQESSKIKEWLTREARRQVIAQTARFMVATWKFRCLRRSRQLLSVKKFSQQERINKFLLERWLKLLDVDNKGKIKELDGWFQLTESLGKTEQAGEALIPPAVTEAAVKFQQLLQSAEAKREVAAKQNRVVPAKDKAKAKVSQPALSKDQGDLLNVLFSADALGGYDERVVESLLTEQGKQHLAQMRAELDRLLKATAVPTAHSIRDIRKKDMRDMRVCLRGDPRKPGEVAPRRFPRVLSPVESKPFTLGSGRLQLAHAIASPNNPLTARVMVNRIWQHHFGRGIVATPSDFGSMGERPTHPALLDWLALRFVDSGWSIKAMHREIMLSATYQQGSDADERNFAIDGDNQWLWRMNRRRLEVEAWRDALLEVTGELDKRIGGPPDASLLTSLRRSIYSGVSRHDRFGDSDRFLRLFDFPDPNLSSEGRLTTANAQQRLFILNSRFMMARAKALAQRLLRERDNDRDRVVWAYLLLYGRPPTDGEQRLGLEFLANVAGSDVAVRTWERYTHVLLAANEFMYVE